MAPPRRMVVVDDDAKVRALLERAFRAPEFETHSFATAEAALLRIEEIRPDCVVAEALAPDMDGPAFLRAVRAVPGLDRVPLIAIAAARYDPRVKALLAARPSAFLLKPFPLRELIDRVRALLERPAGAGPAAGADADAADPTLPVRAAPHTKSTAAVRRMRPAGTTATAGTPAGASAAAEAAAAPAAPPEAEPAAVDTAPYGNARAPAAGNASEQTTTSPALGRTGAAPRAPRRAPTSVRVSPVRIVVNPPGSVASRPPGGAGMRRVDVGPTNPALGFGRFTRVEARNRSLVVLTEAVPEPRFTVTTVIAEKGVPLRKIESALPHALVREEDDAIVRRQLDLQHEDALRRLDDLVLDEAPRRVLWSDQSRSVEAGVLAWAMSAVAQLAETQAGTEETARQLRQTRGEAPGDEEALRAFEVTAFARVVVAPRHAERVPRRAVRAVAAWCRAFAAAALQIAPEDVGQPVRHATRRYSVELERMGFYDRLLPRAPA